MSGFRGRPNNALTRDPKFPPKYSTVPGTILRTTTQPPRDFTRGLVVGTPRFRPFAGRDDMKIANISASYTAGLQTRDMIRFAGRTVIQKGPGVVAKAIKNEARGAVRGIISPYNMGVQTYQFVRSGRIIRGRTSAVERAADQYVQVSGRFLDRLGLAPGVRSSVGSLIRIPIYGGVLATVAGHAERVRDTVIDVSQTLTNYVSLARSSADRFDRALRPSDSTVSGGTPALPVGVSPAPTGGGVGPVVLPPPVPVKPKPTYIYVDRVRR